MKIYNLRCGLLASFAVFGAHLSGQSLEHLNTSAAFFKAQTLSIQNFSNPDYTASESRLENWVQNAGFEQTTQQNLPTGEYPISMTERWTSPNASFPVLQVLENESVAKNDLDLDLSQKKVKPFSGRCAVGLTTYGTTGNKKEEIRDFLQGTLRFQMEIGKRYDVRFRVHFHCEGTNNVGIAFVSSPLNMKTPSRPSIKPQVNESRVITSAKNEGAWHEVSGTFTATEAFQHFIIGNFFSDAETRVKGDHFHHHFAYIDDVFVSETATNGTWVGGNPQPDDAVASSNPTVLRSFSKIELPTAGVKAESIAGTTQQTSINDLKKGDILTLDKVFFQYNSANLMPEAVAQLNKLTDLMRLRPTMNIRVKGHTSTEGNEAYNLELSQRRAQTVLQFLKEKGIEIGRLQAQGLGEKQPVFSEGSADRDKNRRVDFEIIEN
jgi:outer membrane protein OmpA-like peptidoglycan-associated protein